MTNNYNNQPLEAFHVQSSLLQNSPRPAAGKGNGGAGNTGGSPGNSLERFPWWNETRWLFMALFGLIYWLTERDAILRPMTILVLLACLLFRMEGRAREIAGVPLTLAAIKLAYQMTPKAIDLPGTHIMLTEPMKAALTGLPWVPMFLAICIFYLPQNATVTGTIVRAAAFALLISGLIPGDGYIVILGMIQYTLFLGVLIGLIADHPWTSARNGEHAVTPAHA